MLSKKAIWENYGALILDTRLDCIEPMKEEDIIELSGLVAAHGITGFDYDGILWNNDSRTPEFSRFNIDSVNSVARILSKIDNLFGQSPASYTKWRSSYGLKHDMEFIRRHQDYKNPYVSNGEFMAGYLYYMSSVMGMDPRSIRSRIRPELIGGLNLFMKVSPAYQAIADIARDMGWNK